MPFEKITEIEQDMVIPRSDSGIYFLLSKKASCEPGRHIYPDATRHR